MTSLVLVRHGETVWHAENRYTGVSDVELTARGVQQAHRLAGWAKTAGLGGVWTSPLTRTQRTARVCAELTGIPLQVDARLRELDFGEAEGRTLAELDQRFPAARRAFGSDPVEHHFPSGEHPAHATARFTACLRDVADRHPGDRVLVVTHTTVIRLALCELIGVPLSQYRRLFPVVGNCCLTEIRLQDGHVALMEFNSPIDREVGRTP